MKRVILILLSLTIAFSFFSIAPAQNPGSVAMCGDTNNDAEVNIGDAVYLIAYIFKGGPEPYVYETGDVNCDGSVDVSDVVYLIKYVFFGGTSPCDPTGDGIPDC